MSLGLFPAAVMRVGFEMIVGMAGPVYGGVVSISIEKQLIHRCERMTFSGRRTENFQGADGCGVAVDHGSVEDRPAAGSLSSFHLRESEIVRGVPRFPLDVAADAGVLFRRRCFAGQHGIKCGAKVFSCHRKAVARTAVVELPAVNEPMVFVEKIKVGRAGGAIRLRHGLRFIMEIRERVAGILHFLLHFFRAIVGIIGGVVGTDGDDSRSPGVIIPRELREPGSNVFHVGTVIADERHDQRLAFEIRKRNRFPVRVRQSKVWRGRAERQHGGIDSSHGGNLEWLAFVVERKLRALAWKRFYKSPMNISIEHLGLPARDPIVLRDWYVKTLGAKVVFDNGQTPPMFLLSVSGGVMIEIYGSEAVSKETANNKLAGWRHVALRVDSIEAAKGELEKRGVKFSEEIKPAGGGGRILFFQDAEGNLLHLVERSAGSALAR
jgi:glyoxylase I family protein